MKTHRWALCDSSHIIGWILYLELDGLKDVVDNSVRNVNFLNNKSGRMFVVFSITNSLSENSNI
jgi:hypothetical protein